MTNAPSIPATTAITATRPWVRIADAPDVRPNVGNVAVYLRPLQIARFAGGRELDTCQFDYNLAATGERIQDTFLTESWNRQVDVRVPTAQSPAGAGILFWGETATSQIRINRNGESSTIQAVVSPPLFGDIFRGIPMRSTAGVTILSEVDAVFNPMIDGKIVPNKSATRRDPDYLFPLFVSPDAVRTAAAETEEGDSAALWTLRDALNMFFGWMNGDGFYIRNWFILSNDPVVGSAPPLVNVRIRRGMYLPQVLDELLQPLGFNWYVDPGIADVADNPYSPADEAELSARPEIVIYKRGVGRPVFVYFQRVGEALDFRKSNAPDINAEIDILDIANNVTGHGSFYEKEMTIELTPAWDFDDDELDVDELDPTVEGSLYHAGKQNVWRRFVLNEAGDWNGTRTMTGAVGFGDIWESYIKRRRRFFPCLTLLTTIDGETKRRPPFVEYYDPEAGGGEGGWLEVPSDWSYKILPDELGVIFTGKRIPGELYNLGQNVRVRVTGVVIGDHRLTSTSTVAGTSPNSNNVDLLLDVSDKFHHRERLETGLFRSRFSVEGLAEEPLGGGPEITVTFTDSDETDDLSELQTFLDKLVNVEQAAKATAHITLNVIDYSYEIGDVVVGIYGRNISFNRLVYGAGERFMQITSVVHNFERQTTTLKIESEESAK